MVYDPEAQKELEINHAAPYGRRAMHYAGRVVIVGPASVSVAAQASSLRNLDRSYECIVADPEAGVLDYGVQIKFNNEIEGKPLTEYQERNKHILNYWAIHGMAGDEYETITHISASNGVQTRPISHVAIASSNPRSSIHKWLTRYGTESDAQRFGSLLVRHHTARIAGVAVFDRTAGGRYQTVGRGILGAVTRPRGHTDDDLALIELDRDYLHGVLNGISTYHLYNYVRPKHFRLLPPAFDFSDPEPNIFMEAGDVDLLDGSAEEINTLICKNLNMEITAGVATLKLRRNRSPEIALFNANYPV